MTRAGPRVLALIVLMAVARPAGADRIRIAVDNDFFNFWERPRDRPDFGYTHGGDLTWEGAPAPRRFARGIPSWLAGTDADLGAPRIRAGIRQAIYSPWRLPPDRLYAGWIELNAGIRRESARGMREVIVHAGVTGPPSFGERTQKYIHRRFGLGTPPDWSHQLPYEPAMAIETGGAERIFERGTLGGPRWEAAPAWRARIGTYAVDARLGLETTLGIAPPAPWRGGSASNTPGAIYLRAAARIDVIARDEFLDGTLFRHSAGVSATPLVPELESGLGARFRALALEWHVVRRAKEFATQPEPHTYSSIILTLTP